MHGMFYFVFVVFLLVVIEVALITNYVVLSSEQPCWWWRVWWGASMIGGYTFVIMLLYLLIDMRYDMYTTLISYAAASALVSSMMGLMCASLALWTTFSFNLRMYEQVKLE